MKNYQKVVALVVLIAIVFAGVLFYTPRVNDHYPKDLSVQEYKDNIVKNIELVIKTYEKIDAPTFKECEIKYQDEVKPLSFYPTAETTLEKAGKVFLQEDKLPVLQKWRVKRFLHKNYPQAYEFDKQYRASVDDSMKKDKNGMPFIEEKTYTYKDGSIISFGVGGMSVQYADEKPAATSNK